MATCVLLCIMKSILGNRYGLGFLSFFLSLFVVMATCVLLCITLYYEINIGGSLWAGSFFQSEPKVPHPLHTHVSDLVRHSLCWFVLFNSFLSFFLSSFFLGWWNPNYSLRTPVRVPTSVSKQIWICIWSFLICTEDLCLYRAPWHSTNSIWI